MLSLADRAQVPRSTDIYVSAVSYRGIPVGNDTTGNGSASLPFLTIEKGISAASPGARVLLNGNPSSPTDYRAATLLTITTAVTIDSFEAYGASISATTTAGPIATIAPTAGQTITFGSVTLDCRSLNSRAIDCSSSPSVLYHLTLTGTIVKDWALDGILSSGAANVPVSVTLTNCTFSSSVNTVSYAVVLGKLSAGGLTVSGGSYTIGAAGVGNAVLSANASASGVTCSITGATIDTTADAGMSGSNLRGIYITNILGAIIENNDVTVDSTAASVEGVGITILATNDAAAKDSSNFSVSGNTVFVDGSGGGYVQIGLDGVQASDPADGFVNDGVVTENTGNCSAAAQAGGLHGYFLTGQSNSTCFRNLASKCGIGVVLKETNGAIAYSNVIEDAASSGLLLKGAKDSQFLHNTVNIGAGGGNGVFVENNPTSGIDTSGGIVSGNIIYGTLTNTVFVLVNAAQGVTFDHNDYFTTGTISTSGWTWLGVAKATLAAWKASGEATALGVDPLFVNVSAHNYALQAASPMRGAVALNPSAPDDYAGLPFLSPSSIGAFEYYA